MKLAEMLVECGAVKFGDFTLTSGKKSKYYVDIKMASTNPQILREIAKEMAAKMEGEDRIAGVELGAVPLAASVALETNVPFLIIRKGKREHGTGKRVEGSFLPGQKVLMVEDVVTTAGSSIEGVRALRDAGLVVERVIVVVDRQEGGGEALSNEGIELISLVTAKELLEMRK
ncbi:MAG: orotate phosphoribosyltransferase [Candidatus Thermoplasmatota archaeon]|nr:orotate phosphoribosyltransferase [Candidatus Thermoplasmatota archaeon]